MPRKLFLFAAVPAISLLMAFAQADEILVGAGPGLSSGADCPCGTVVAGSGWPFPDGGAQAAVEFTLSDPVFVSTVDVLLDTVKGDQLTLSVVSALTGPATTFASETFTAAGETFPNFDPETVTIDQSLAPATYFLLLSVVSPDPEEWAVSDGSLIQNAGTVAEGTWYLSGAGATWTFYDTAGCEPTCGPDVFAINGVAGRATATPEPASALLLGVALLGLGMLQYKRRRIDRTPP